MSTDLMPLYRYWLSWVQPTDDYRPLTDPPHESVIGWWCSGYTSNDRATLCAVVGSETMERAKRAIRESWPEAPGIRGNWRIDDEHDPGWLPGDRFPMEKGWMLERHRRTA